MVVSAARDTTARGGARPELAGGALIGGGPFFGLASGVSWGAGDFAGGLIGRYASTFLALLVSQTVGLAGIVVLLVVSAEQLPDPASIAWATAAGASGIIGVGCFFYALSRGTMGVIAPLAALIGAGVPVTVDLVNGDTLPLARLAGMAVALVAVALISLPGGERPGDERRRLRLDIADLPLVVVSGLGFAGFFLFIDRAAVGGLTWWPLAVVRVVGLVFVLAGVAFAMVRARGGWRRRANRVLGIDRLRSRGLPHARLGLVLFVAGVGDLGGNTFFLMARQADAFAVAVVLSSLYPVVTTILAATLLHERLRPLQVLGVVLATLSVPLLR